MNTARVTWIAVHAGTQTAALAFGGDLTLPGAAVTGATEQYDGTTWTTSPASLATARMTIRWSWNSIISFRIWWRNSNNYSSNRRMDWSRSSINKNNNGKLIWQII
jgi:hypothetical protein